MKIKDLLKIYIIVSIIFFSIIIASILVMATIKYSTMVASSNLLKQNMVCLGDDEIVDYKVEKKESGDTYIIFIKDKLTKQTKRSFEIKNVRTNYHPIEFKNCGIYITQMSNYNVAKEGNQNIGYKEEIKKYNYNNIIQNIILIAEKPKEFISYYSPDFRVSSNEKYIALIKSYLSQNDYSLIIKDLNTKKDVFTLLASNIAKENQNLIGSFGVNKWSDDDRYFWGDIFEGAYVNGYYRIDTQNWTHNLYEAPDGAMGGSELNINTGWLPIQPGQIWTGDYQLDQDLKERYRKEGKKSELYLYNLFTKEKILIETTDEPIYWFKPKWLSDNELEYKMPDGNKKNYFLHKYIIKLENQKDGPIWYYFNEDKERSLVLVVFDVLSVTNLITQEQKYFSLYELAHPDIISYLKDINYVSVQYYLYTEDIQLSQKEDKVLGTIKLFSSADPPKSSKESFFEIDTQNWQIQKFSKLLSN